MPSPWPFLDHPGPLPFAHRGGAGDWPENTMPAFEGAVALGYRYVETDVHVTADGVLLAFHDDRLDRVTNRTGVISELPYREVRQARVDGREPIPLLEDLLGTCPRRSGSTSTPSTTARSTPLAEVLRRTGSIDRVCVGVVLRSSGSAVLRRRLGPAPVHLARAEGHRPAARCGPSAFPPAGSRRRAPRCRTGIRACQLVDRRFVDAAHASGPAGPRVDDRRPRRDDRAARPRRRRDHDRPAGGAPRRARATAASGSPDGVTAPGALSRAARAGRRG